MYSEMQKKADNSAQKTPGSSNDIYSGAFAYTSPPERHLQDALE